MKVSGQHETETGPATTGIVDDLDFSALLDLTPDEIVTKSLVRDVSLSNGKILALITLDNGRDHTRPNTLGPRSLLNYAETLESLRERTIRGEIHSVAVTGKPYILAAGADLSGVRNTPNADEALLLAKLGHFALSKLSSLKVPSFAFVNGMALGGGLELALHANYRSINSSATAIALPEVFLGLVPGWGGAYLLPNLIGIERALKVIVENPLKQNRMLNGAEALELGIADVGFGSAAFLEQSIAWADSVINKRITVKRAHKPGRLERLVKWDAAVKIATKQVRKRIGSVPAAPFDALKLLRDARTGGPEAAFIREDEVLATLIPSEQFKASLYAFNLVQKGSKHALNSVDIGLARKVTRIGVIGAGYMARQLALHFVRKLKVPVIITDVDGARIESAIEHIQLEIAKLATKGRVKADEATRLIALISGSTNVSDFEGCDWVIEAVVEELSVKQKVLTEVERVLTSDAILATNTSSLSVSEIGAKLTNPERLVGFHFFTPVSIMPLVEVVNASETNTATIATAVDIATKLGKTPVITTDTTGFVVNRILAVLLGEAMRAVDSGSDFSVVDEAIAPLGLPMSPSQLLDLVGLTVGAHVLDTHHAAFGERFYRSDNLHRLAAFGSINIKDSKGNIIGYNNDAIAAISGNVGNNPLNTDAILATTQNALAREAQLMLSEKVVARPEDIDLCLILGAGFPFHLGGLTPYLDRTGATERATPQKRFHPLSEAAK